MTHILSLVAETGERRQSGRKGSFSMNSKSSMDHYILGERLSRQKEQGKGTIVENAWLVGPRKETSSGWLKGSKQGQELAIHGGRDEVG